jgi:hypothetical protein
MDNVQNCDSYIVTKLQVLVLFEADGWMKNVDIYSAGMV